MISNLKKAKRKRILERANEVSDLEDKYWSKIVGLRMIGDPVPEELYEQCLSFSREYNALIKNYLDTK